MEDFFARAKFSCATYYYHILQKQFLTQAKYVRSVRKASEIEAPYAENAENAENNDRYGYRRIGDELRNRGRIINHKSVYLFIRKIGVGRAL